MTRVDRLVLAGALALPWLFIWQGLDVTDQGYMLTISRCFLRHPEAVAHTSHMWLTNTVGGVWDALFGRLGVVGHRALWAICISLGMFASFRALRSLFSVRTAVLAVLVTSSFLSGRRDTWFSYNVMTGLLSCLAAVTLLGALKHNDHRKLVLTGFLLGLSPFARLPNVLHVSLLAAPVFAALVDRSRLKLLPRQLAAGALGYVLAVLVAFGGMLVLGHFGHYVTAVKDLVAPTVPSEYYSQDALSQLLLTDLIRMVPPALGIVAAGAGVVWLAPRLPKAARVALYVVLAGAMLAVLTRASHHSSTEAWPIILVGPSALILAGIAGGVLRRSLDERIACFIGLVALVVTPLGSGNGVRVSYLGMWFSLPLVFCALAAAGEGVRAPLRALALIAGVAVLGESLHRDMTYTYRDGPRAELLTPVDHPQLRAQFTGAARAKVVGEVLQALDERVSRGDLLLAYEGTPLLQFLTYTRPYTGRPWIMTDDVPHLVPGMLSSAQRTFKCLPVAVRSTGSARGSFWPQDRRRLDKQNKATRSAIAAFLKEHDYRRTWRNSFFEILEPPRKPGAPARCR